MTSAGQRGEWNLNVKTQTTELKESDDPLREVGGRGRIVAITK